MRKPWIAFAMIALVVGLAAGYRMGRVGNPQRASVRADRVAEAAPDESPPPIAGAPAATGGSVGSRSQVRKDEAPPRRSAEHEAPTAPQHDAVPLLSAPAHVETGLPAQASVDGDKAASPVPPTVPSPVAPTIRPLVASPASVPATIEPPRNEPVGSDATPAPVPADDPESDRHPPVLQYLRFDPAEIRDGGVTMLSVGAADDLSGVKLVFGTVRSPSEAAILPFSAQDATGSGVFTARITIPQKAETGDWFVGSIQIVDKANNPLNLVFAKATVPQGGAVRVSSDDSDATAPDVHRVTIDKGTVGAGEKNQIVVDVDDDRSGVASVTGTFQSPSKSAFIPFGCRANGESSWVGDVAIPANADCGEWTLSQLRVADKANNTAYLTSESPQIGPVGFVVSSGGDCDSEPPMIDSLLVSPGIVSNAAASEVSLIFTTHDDRSGVGSLSGRVEGPVSANGQVPKIFFACESDPAHPEGPMTARISVPQYAAKGIWRVALVQLMDKARNTRTYNRDDPALLNASFMVE